MKDLISVIVPVYKVENYLERCVQSICAQTYSNLEIILVDDGSPDSCGDLCNVLATRDSRIVVIHKTNGGLSSARNAGIDKAKGEYIVFVDSDDFINVHMIEYLYASLKENQADMSICQFQYVYENENIDSKEEVDNDSIEVFMQPDIVHNLFNEKNLQTVVAWNKLYKKSLWNNLRYPFGKIHEDEFVIHHLLGLCEKIVYIDAKLYYYLQRSTSIMGTSYSLKRLHGVEALKERLDFYKDTAFESKAIYRYLQTIIENYFLVEEFYSDRKDILNQLKADFKLYIKSAKELTKSTKIRFHIFSICPSIYYFLKTKGIIKT